MTKNKHACTNAIHYDRLLWKVKRKDYAVKRDWREAHNRPELPFGLSHYTRRGGGVGRGALEKTSLILHNHELKSVQDRL